MVSLFIFILLTFCCHKIDKRCIVIGSFTFDHIKFLAQFIIFFFLNVPQFSEFLLHSQLTLCFLFILEHFSLLFFSSFLFNSLILINMLKNYLRKDIVFFFLGNLLFGGIDHVNSIFVE